MLIFFGLAKAQTAAGHHRATERKKAANEIEIRSCNHRSLPAHPVARASRQQPHPPQSASRFLH
jgi:hypothetical protein